MKCNSQEIQQNLHYLEKQQNNPTKPHTYNSHIHYSHILIVIDLGFFSYTCIQIRKEKISISHIKRSIENKNTKHHKLS